MPEGIANADVPEIKITPEMIEAGVDRLLEYSINFDDPSGVVRQVLTSYAFRCPRVMFPKEKLRLAFWKRLAR